MHANQPAPGLPDRARGAARLVRPVPQEGRRGLRNCYWGPSGPTVLARMSAPRGSPGVLVGQSALSSAPLLRKVHRRRQPRRRPARWTGRSPPAPQRVRGVAARPESPRLLLEPGSSPGRRAPPPPPEPPGLNDRRQWSGLGRRWSDRTEPAAPVSGVSVGHRPGSGGRRSCAGRHGEGAWRHRKNVVSVSRGHRHAVGRRAGPKLVPVWAWQRQ